MAQLKDSRIHICVQTETLSCFLKTYLAVVIVHRIFCSCMCVRAVCCRHNGRMDSMRCYRLEFWNLYDSFCAMLTLPLLFHWDFIFNPLYSRMCQWHTWRCNTRLMTMLNMLYCLASWCNRYASYSAWFIFEWFQTTNTNFYIFKFDVLFEFQNVLYVAIMWAVS